MCKQQQRGKWKEWWSRAESKSIWIVDIRERDTQRNMETHSFFLMLVYGGDIYAAYSRIHIHSQGRVGLNYYIIIIIWYINIHIYSVRFTRTSIDELQTRRRETTKRTRLYYLTNPINCICSIDEHYFLNHITNTYNIMLTVHFFPSFFQFWVAETARTHKSYYLYYLLQQHLWKRMEKLNYRYIYT